MKLTDLDPKFIRHQREHHEAGESASGSIYATAGESDVMVTVGTLGEAQGVRFLCPACFAKNGGKVGTHMVVCWSRSRGVPDDVDPKPGRWTLDGTGMDDLTLNGDPPGNARSVLLLGGCGWHGFITNGEAT
jgi:hypothetical protein